MVNDAADANFCRQEVVPLPGRPLDIGSPRREARVTDEGEAR